MPDPDKPNNPQGTSGDQIRRDWISTGDIDGSVVAIGAGAKVIYKNVERALTKVEVLEKEEAFERKRLADAVTAYVQRLQRKAEEAKERPILGSPYKALLEYDIRDTALFYGRSRAIQGLLNQLERSPLTVLHADSGVGKTSLLKAGIVPRLLAAGHLPLYLRPYRTPVHLAVKHELLMQLDQTPHLRDSSLNDFLRQVTDLLGGQRLVVIVDQFEELFTEQDAEVRTAFITELAPCLDDDLLPVRLIFALRDEWFGQLGTFRPHIRQPFANEFLLRALTRDEAIEVIVEPAKHHGIEYETGLVQNLIRDLGEAEVAPPQVQLVCSTLFEALNGQTTITKKMYTDAGGTAGILRGHLERVLSREVPPEQRRSARLLLEALITSDKRRALRSADSLRDEVRALGINRVALDEILRILVDSRLLRVEEIGEEKTELAYELAHDYLLDEIELDPASQARKAAQELLEQKVPYFTREGLLLSRDELDIINPHRDRLTLTEDAAQLLRRSQAVVMRRRRITMAGAAIAIVLILGAVFSFVTLQRKAALELAASESMAAAVQAEIATTAVAAQAEAEAARLLAEEARDRAEEEYQIATSRQLAAQSASQLDQDPSLGLLLSVEALQTANTYEARNALLNGLTFSPHLATILHGHRHFATSVAFSPAGDLIASGGCLNLSRGLGIDLCFEGEIRLWNLASGNELAVLPAHDGNEFSFVRSLAFSPDGRILASGAGDRTVILWDTDRWDPLFGPLTGHERDVTSVVFSADGKTLASVDLGNRIFLWDIGTGRLLGEFLMESEAGLVGIAFLPSFPSGDLLVFCDANGILTVLDTRDGHVVFSKPIPHEGPIASFAHSPDGRIWASGGLDGSISIWSWDSWNPLGPLLRLHSGSVSSLAFSPNGTILASGGTEENVILWDVQGGRPLTKPLQGHTDRVNDLAFSNDGLFLASAAGDSNSFSQDNRVLLWDLANHLSLGQPIPPVSERVYSLAFAPPKGRILAMGTDNSITLWDMHQGRQIGEALQGHIGGVTSLQFDPIGETLASGSSDGNVILWDEVDLQPRSSILTGHADGIIGLAFDPDSHLMASFSRDGTVMLWDVANARAYNQPLSGPSGLIGEVAFGPLGKTLASGSASGVVVWDIESGERLTELPVEGVKGGALGVGSFGPDLETFVAIGSTDRILSIQSLPDGEVVGQLPADNLVVSAAISPDGAILATGDDTSSGSSKAEAEVRIWDLEQQQPLGQPLIGHRGLVWDVAFSPDGGTLASGDSEGTVILWDVELESWVRRACRIANRNLTIEEWEQFLGDRPYSETCPDNTLMSQAMSSVAEFSGLDTSLLHVSTPAPPAMTPTPSKPSSDLPTFLLENAISIGNLLFGPFSGDLIHATGSVSVSYSGLDLAEFIADATFHNPYSLSQGKWDFGFFFRNVGLNDEFRITVRSNATWSLNDRRGDDNTFLAQGDVPNLNTGRDGWNRLTLVVFRDEGILFVNESMIATLPLLSRVNSGDVSVGSGLTKGYKVPGETTRFEDFTVWSLE